MTRHTTGWAAVAAALMLILAGCAGGVPSGPSGGDAGTADGGDDGGTVNFYISDQQNAIDQFEHLNVTITEVTLVRADTDDADDTEDAESDDSDADDENETETTEPTETPESDDADDGGEQVTYEVDNVTLDLTELQGANASKLGSVPVPNGTYTKVSVEISSVEGTLTDGSSADVKLPSNKLRLNKEFTVGNGEEVDFVFDVTVFERGPNGYILKPVAGESGTSDEVEIRDVDEDDEREEAEDADDADESDDATETEEAESDDESDRGEDTGDDSSGQSSMDFYLSDEENAMGDFAHLNVTVTKVGLQRGGESGGWVEKDVDDRTIDLTTLPGTNATRLGTFGVDNGTYTKVFVYVDEVDATLENGDSANVKLPSSKLQLNKEFTVGNGEEVDFVYDMSVFKAGNSGKYILKPVVSESGTSDEVPIEDVDETDSDDDSDEASAELNASFVGNVTAGENATVEVTRNGSAVEDATVEVTQEVDGEETTETLTTDANGTVTFAVDANASELSVEATAGDGEAELEREFETEEDDSEESEEVSESADLSASFAGNVTAGENATVEVTRNGSTVENATVEVTQEVDGDETTETYSTDVNGTVTFAVDANATELTVEVTAGDDEAELEREFETTGGDDADGTDDESDAAALRASAV
ncbi:DUF4382 domain-containing protein [Halobaculum sp. WSA2]|uniref:DUF4382 domain-containing protein n=1 Tax=Halobaculum saliterrae TaxID=2073113 RepID=A0A6B0SUF9_9EURY|nr:DUF4382 domain-containing protein [Halobaculum saliterrae]MXR40243.1 DUF4382 domain-containing protein [Halobaculum saliterrae]